MGTKLEKGQDSVVPLFFTCVETAYRMLVALTLVVTLVVLLLGYCHHRQQYWQSKGVYVPPMLPVIGHTYSLFSRKTNFYEIMKEYLMKSKSPYMGWYEGLKPTLVVHDLSLLKSIMVKDFDHFVDRRPLHLGNSDEVFFKETLFSLSGEKWKRLRSTMSPTFTSGKLKGIFPLIEAKCKKLIDWCLREGITRDKVEMNSLFNRFTLDGIATSAFGIETNCIDNEKDEFAIAADKITTPPGILGVLKLALLIISPRLFCFLRLRFLDPAINIFTRTAKETLKLRKNSERRGDFIDLMLEAKQEHGLDTAKSKYPVTDDIIIPQVVLFLFAGFQTTSTALSFVTGLLARHREVQERLREEIRSLIETYGELSYKAIGEAKYLEACLHEALRLYPPGTIIERIATKEYKLPGTDLKIEKGTVVMANVWALNRDPRIWEDPNDFKPERFLPENKTPEQSFAFHSFGQGPRNCIGMRFALLETKLALAHLVLNMEFHLAPGHEGPLEIEVAFNGMKAKDGINLVFGPVQA
ncbi:cytochrome P450 9e2-like isoform X2 [Oratosquilla oratoria]|uniref:cytochrome P450 9e2-like isoform X2 n=1 Tax=Oratosquilla oratoria TaxID=337810 RepID=UPI003F76EA7A